MVVDEGSPESPESAAGAAWPAGAWLPWAAAPPSPLGAVEVLAVVPLLPPPDIELMTPMARKTARVMTHHLFHRGFFG